jgi:hypothetical protein
MVGVMVSFEKRHFNGHHALLVKKERSSRRRLMAVEIAGKNPAHGSLIYDRRKGVRQIGEIKSALWSPTSTCECNIALAMIDAPYFKSLREFWGSLARNRLAGLALGLSGTNCDSNYWGEAALGGGVSPVPLSIISGFHPPFVEIFTS